jgi:hypothetical protein
MIIYNVTLKVEKQVSGEWITWMKTEHMPDLMATGLFTDCRLSRLLEQDETDGFTFTAQYICNSLAEYNTYIDEYATEMRDKALKLFAGKFVAFRTIMEVI